MLSLRFQVRTSERHSSTRPFEPSRYLCFAPTFTAEMDLCPPPSTPIIVLKCSVCCHLRRDDLSSLSILCIISRMQCNFVTFQMAMFNVKSMRVKRKMQTWLRREIILCFSQAVILGITPESSLNENSRIMRHGNNGHEKKHARSSPYL